MKCFGKSVVGMQRKNNEDSIYVGSKNAAIKNIFIVADGMGGHNAGDVASKMAIEKFLDSVKPKFENEIDKETVLDTLVEGVIYANKMVFEASKENEEQKGMGTTFTCVYILDKKLYAVHVGDSRIYIIRNGQIKQITNDHSFVMEMVKKGEITLEQAKTHPDRNMITRAVGTEEKINVDTVIKDIENKDTVLICSDGLSNMINDSDIEKIVDGYDDIKIATETLVKTANENGGRDNISAVIIRNEVEA